MRPSATYFIALIILGSQWMGCKNNNPDDPKAENFDKAAMLRNIAETVIEPAYQDARIAAVALETALAVFEQTPNEAEYSNVKLAFGTLYEHWQKCTPFEFGPAADQGLRLSVNTFPTDTARIHTLIASTGYDLGAAQNAAAKGLPALDFVLFTLDANDASATGAMSFLKQNAALVRTELEGAMSSWNSSYSDEFIASTGSDAGSSISMLVNALNFDFELVKNAKVGIPLGKKTLGVVQPSKVEAYYGGNSFALLKINLTAIKDGFQGGTGSGLDDYLDALDAKYGEALLSKAIKDGFDDAISAIAVMESQSLAQAIDTDKAKVEDLYAKLQDLVVLLKTDMPSQLGVQITYQDNDGD